MPLPKTVLCYGDSNTFGHATVDAPRRALRTGRALDGRARRRPRTGMDGHRGGARRAHHGQRRSDRRHREERQDLSLSLPDEPQAARRGRHHARHQRSQGALQQDAVGDRRRRRRAGRYSSRRPRPAATRACPRSWWSARRRPRTASPNMPRCSSARRRNRTAWRPNTAAWPGTGASISSMPVRSSSRARWTASISIPTLSPLLGKAIAAEIGKLAIPTP